MSMNYNFSIKNIAVATDKDFVTALRIYADITPTVIMTNTNELADWLDYNEDNCFVPMQFALKSDDIVIGYAFISYIKSTKIAIIDYIALQQNFRLNTIFLAFVNLLQSYVREHYVCNYFIVEISNRGNGREMDKESVLFRKLLCLEGFCKINYRYITPPFGPNAPETTFDAFLYIKSNDAIHSIRLDTFLQFVQSIYEYYYQWFSKVLTNDEIVIYKKILDKWFSDIKGNIKEIESKVTPVDCPLLSKIGEKTYGQIPKTKPKKKTYLILFLLILPLLIIIVYYAILNKLGIPMQEVSSLIGAILTAEITVIVSMYFSNKKL